MQVIQCINVIPVLKSHTVSETLTLKQTVCITSCINSTYILLVINVQSRLYGDLLLHVFVLGLLS